LSDWTNLILVKEKILENGTAAVDFEDSKEELIDWIKNNKKQSKGMLISCLIKD
jgi:hypothetical protein